MAVVETERHGQVLVVRMNRPERLNALNTEAFDALSTAQLAALSAVQIDKLRRGGLHSVGEFIGRDSRFDLGAEIMIKTDVDLLYQRRRT